MPSPSSPSSSPSTTAPIQPKEHPVATDAVKRLRHSRPDGATSSPERTAAELEMASLLTRLRLDRRA
jgi:hypothetical protein